MNETQVFSRPFDFDFEHRAVGTIRHRNGHSAIECQCGRGVAGVTPDETRARWGRHIAEERQS